MDSVITVSKNNDYTVITVNMPVVDASNIKDLRVAMDQATEGKTQVVIDLSKVEFMDSSGLGSLISTLRHMNTRGGELKLCSLQSRVQMLMELTRLYRVFPIFKDQDAATAPSAPA